MPPSPVTTTTNCLTIATFTPSCNGAFGGACVPQKGITDLADSLGDRLMYRFAYWEDQPLANVTGDSAQTGSGAALVCELGRDRLGWPNRPPLDRVHSSDQGALPPTGLGVFQQGTYAPDGNWRWMGSLTRDKVGDILLGYSESCGSTCPGGTPDLSLDLRSRTPGQRPSGPRQSGSRGTGGWRRGSQPDTSNRWGDYSSMRIDTTDGMSGCTFWYTTEYYMVTQRFDWSTQIASVKFSNCN